MNKEGKKDFFSNKKYVILIIMLFLLLGLLFSYLSINSKHEPDTIYAYNQKSSMNYKVYLKKNNSYDEKYLEYPKYNLFPSSLSDYIDIDFLFELNGSQVGTFNYNYDIKATLHGEYENTNTPKAEIWTKEFDLNKENKDKIKDSNSLVIKENLKIDYDYYNNQVNEYKNKYHLPIDAHLDIKMTINYSMDNISLNGSNCKNGECKSILNFKVPLTSSTYKITTDCPKSEGTIEGIPVKDNIVSEILSLIFIFIAFIIFVLWYETLFDNNNKQTKVEKKYNKILKE